MKIKKSFAASCVAFCVASAIFFAACLFSSCSELPGYAEPEEQAIVSAIGFDADGEAVTVTVQIALDGDGGCTTVSGSGKSIEEALSVIAALETKSLEISHLALIALGRGISAPLFNEIMEFCERGDEISLSALLVSCSDAEKLLSSDGASGYRLINVVSGAAESSSLGNEARLYQVRSAILSDDPVFSLPHFFAADGKHELYGVRIYRGGEPLTVLDRAEGSYYMMIRGLFDCGVFSGDATGISGSVGVSRCRTKYFLSDENGSPRLDVRCRISIDSEIADDENAKAIAQATAENMTRLYNKLSELHGDVFGLIRAARREGLDEAIPFKELDVRFECEIGR